MTLTENKKGMKILVVDNHPQTATELTTNLSWAGYNVLEANNEKDAAEICDQEKPDLIIIDKETISPSCIDNRKIILTGFDINKSSFKKYKNVVVYLEKPISKTDLLKEVSRFLK